jgi:hypothetical protein
MFEDYIQLTNGVSNGQFNDVTMTDNNNNLIPGAKEFLQKWCPSMRTYHPVNALNRTG